MRQMKNIIHSVIFVALVTFVSGCSDDDSAINSASNATDESGAEVIASMLADNPPHVINRDTIKINLSSTTSYPDAPLIYIFSALKRHPQIAVVQISWVLGIASSNSWGNATYQRKTQKIWYRIEWTGGKNSYNDYFVFAGVTPNMLYRAAQNSIESGGSEGGIRNLTQYGCKRIK